MKTIIACICIAMFAISVCQAQGQKFNTPEIKAKDSIIIADLINPAVNTARQQKQDPDWKGLTTTVAAKYDAEYADRTITKARIYYYYSKDWPSFTAAIVHYTEAYEDKDDLKLMNKNANFILKYSTDQKDLKAAKGWMQHAIDKEPTNTVYQATYKAISDKII